MVLPLFLAVADILLWWLFSWTGDNISEPLISTAAFALALLFMLWTLFEVLQFAGSMRSRNEAEE